MPVSALLLTLGAAALHALWNLLVAGSRDPVPVTAAMLGTSIVLFAIPAALTWDVEWRAAPYVVASAAFELAYFVLLATAYTSFELSLVYPVARGLAPVLVLVATVVALGVRPGLQAALGVVVVAAGVLLVRGIRRAADLRGVVLAVGVGACIAGYTIIDKAGLRYAAPLPYFELVATSRDRAVRGRRHPFTRRRSDPRRDRAARGGRGDRRIRGVPAGAGRARASAGRFRCCRARVERPDRDGARSARPPRARIADAARRSGAHRGRRGARGARLTAAPGGP